ncbi:hypothetical protein FB451DRAFT_1513938 [Mycena latifolia]|nr:hypothetical protein FB451DRAFT_1513938 [Mycena latifolia]
MSSLTSAPAASASASPSGISLPGLSSILDPGGDDSTSDSPRARARRPQRECGWRRRRGRKRQCERHGERERECECAASDDQRAADYAHERKRDGEAADVCVRAFLFSLFSLLLLPSCATPSPSRSGSGSAFLRRHASAAPPSASTRTRPQSFEPSGYRTAGALGAGGVVWRKVEPRSSLLAPRSLRCRARTSTASCAHAGRGAMYAGRVPLRGVDMRAPRCCGGRARRGVAVAARVPVGALSTSTLTSRRAGRRGLPTGAEGRAASPSGPPRLRRAAGSECFAARCEEFLEARRRCGAGARVVVRAVCGLVVPPTRMRMSAGGVRRASARGAKARLGFFLVGVGRSVPVGLRWDKVAGAAACEEGLGRERKGLEAGGTACGRCLARASSSAVCSVWVRMSRCVVRPRMCGCASRGPGGCALQQPRAAEDRAPSLVRRGLRGARPRPAHVVHHRMSYPAGRGAFPPLAASCGFAVGTLASHGFLQIP